MTRAWFECENSRREVGLKLGRKLDRLGVEEVVADHDDTWCQTKKSFDHWGLEASGWLVYRSDWPEVRDNGFDRKKVAAFKREMIDTEVRGLRKQYVVNPKIMEMAVRLTASKIGIERESEVVQQAVESVQRIYEKEYVPILYPGATETLDAFAMAGRRVTLATHAGAEWVGEKLTRTGIKERFFRVMCFDINRPKSVQWEEKLEEAGLRGKIQGILFVGDNLAADVVRPLRMGARAGVWLMNGRRYVCGIEDQPSKSEMEELSGKLVKVREVAYTVPGILGMPE